MNIYEKLSAIQAELKSPKDQYNKYGDFNYRSCEGILEAVKPLCAKHHVTLILTDEIVNVGARYYIKAMAKIVDNQVDPNGNYSDITINAYAREEEAKKGMDGSQVTGASSSYARKYALNGLFCIDDAKDSDYTNTGDPDMHGKDVIIKQDQAKRAPTKAEYPARKATPTREDETNQDICNSCGQKIKSSKVVEFSVKKFGVPLCMDCQRDYAR